MTFLGGRITLPSHAVMYNRDVIGFDERKRIYITDIDPEEPFSLDGLMSTKPVVAKEATAWFLAVEPLLIKIACC